MSKKPSGSPQVLIIGAGPTGLTLACELARRNIGIRIIDRAPDFHVGSRAKGLQPRTLEVFDDIGIAAELIAAGTTDLIFRRFNGPHLIGDSRVETQARSDTRYTRGLLLPQWKVEEVLRKRLRQLGIEVERGAELIDFSEREDTVAAKLKTPSGEDTVSCLYLVGCDGGKSKVRKMLGIQFEGETHEEERAFIGDVEVEGLSPDAWHVWMSAERGFFALCPFSCSTSWQLQTAATPDSDGKWTSPDLETFRRLFAQRTGMEGVTLKNATWASLYRVNIRMADRYRCGRVMIAGDAAHVHSIAGGLGMNTGIQDAYNLGWKMAHVLNGQADSSLLDTYEEERLPIAAWTLNISSERHRLVLDGLKKGVRDGLHTVGTKDTAQLDLNYRYSSITADTTAQPSGIQAGDRAPDSPLPGGSWLSDLYRGTHFTLLRAADIPRPSSPLSFKNTQLREFDLPSDLTPLFGREGVDYLVRPDGYIGLITNAGNDAAIRHYLSKLLHHETTR